MHKSSKLRMKWFIENYLPAKGHLKILDVGSYDVNGSYKDLFDSKCVEYLGLDMEKGPNVDLVPKNTYDWQELNTDSFDIVISGQALEHIEFFWETMKEIIRVAKEGALICIIAPNGFEEHRYPVDCWRFHTDGMIALCRYFEMEVIHTHMNAAPSVKDRNWYSDDEADCMVITRKPYKGPARKINLNKYKCVPANHKELRNGMKTYSEYKESISVIAQENNINEEDDKRLKKMATRLKESIKNVLKLQWKDK